MKKIISFCLAILMVFAVFQGAVFAENEADGDDRYLWNETPPSDIHLNNSLIDMFLGVIKNYNEEKINPLDYLEDFSAGVEAGVDEDDPIRKVYISLVEGDDPRNWILMGDVDLDEEITTKDARLVLRIAVGLEEYENDRVPFMAADIDKNGEISTADARAILRAAVGLEKL